MNVYETTLQLDEPQLNLPETFRNKKVRVVVEEVEKPFEHQAAEPLRLATLPLGGLPFNREDCYDDDRLPG